MGNSTGKIHIGREPTEKDLNKYVGKFHFSRQELQKLRLNFIDLSRSIDRDGLIALEEFQRWLGIQNRDLAQRWFNGFDSDRNRAIDFEEFVKTLNLCHKDASLDEKAMFCFNIFDADGNGSLTKCEVKDLLRLSLKENAAVELSDAQLDQVVHQTFAGICTGETISLEQFQRAAIRNPAMIKCAEIDWSRIFG